jgi:DNA-binding transcriptional ArsR family regulator
MTACRKKSGLWKYAIKRLALVRIFHYYRTMETRNVIAALSALAQDSRLAVFRLLVQAGPEGLAASKIAETLDIPPSSLSFHLKELLRADLLMQTKQSRSLIYSVNFATMNEVLGFLTENCCDGNPCSPACSTECSTNEGVSP